ncbi:MAG: T9SS type A sorting domain-containing protein [Candidatus Krumholzibacteria bacterium]|nr:T9SS type A sorting domain-containing protein [Candidatus Krumholzibacteria bacterium]
MRFRKAQVCLIAVLALVLLVPSLNADWTRGGIELSTYPSGQYNHQIISDGSGGCIVVWQDGREGSSVYDIFAQRLDADGNVVWDAGGVNVSELGGSQEEPVLVTDGAGGAIIAYQSDRTGSWDIIAQRINNDGSLAWAAGGITVCGLNGLQNIPRIVSDDMGGAIITWSDTRSGGYDIYAARINSTGSLPWTYNGVPVCTYADNQWNPEITTDGSSGAIIAWIDDRNGNSDIYIQMILFNGSPAWTSNGEYVEIFPHNVIDHQIISDMIGGAIVVWELNYSGDDHNIYAERIHNDGTRLWASGTGVTVSSYSGNQTSPVMVSDGYGGAIISWLDHRNGNHDIYAQHIDYAGGTDWINDGIAICVEPHMQLQPEIVSDDSRGAIILWYDHRFDGNPEVFGQKVAANGITKWPENGMNLTAYPADQYSPKALAIGDGGFIAAWRDLRNLTNFKVYAQIFDGHGYWGDPASVITDVSDVPADQGGSVQITWSPARMDAYPDETITHYTVWRSVSAPAAMALQDEGAIVTSPGAVGLDFEGTAYRTDIQFGAAAAWEWVASVEAHYWEEYAYTCGTLQDFIEGVEDGMHWFVITANTANPFTFWDSAPDSAFSVDNLSPCTPLGLAGEQLYEPEGLELTWEPNSEADLGGYNIYRGTDPTFEPDPSSLLANTCDTMVFDGDWSWDSGYCYKVAAVDIHGNESEYAVLCIEQVTGVIPMPLPDATSLEQNYPNPFNPNTTIALRLKTGGFVNISIFNAAGKLVAVLIDESRPAGAYAAVWNGKSENGTPAASGVYFYRLTAGNYIETRKMILLK